MTPSLKRYAAALLAGTFALPVQARNFECTIADGVHGTPGTTSLAPAAKRDPKIIGSTFMVETSRAGVAGSVLFRTEGQKVEVLRDTEDAYELLLRNQQQDVKTLKLTRFNGKWTFSYYNGWLALLLTGHCRAQ